MASDKDIVERIRLSSPYSEDGTMNSNLALLSEAADEIVRLRARVAASEAVVRQVKHALGCAGCWVIGCACQSIWLDPMSSAINDYDAASRDSGLSPK